MSITSRIRAAVHVLTAPDSTTLSDRGPLPESPQESPLEREEQPSGTGGGDWCSTASYFKGTCVICGCDIPVGEGRFRRYGAGYKDKVCRVYCPTHYREARYDEVEVEAISEATFESDLGALEDRIADITSITKPR